MGCATTTVKIASIAFNFILAFIGFGSLVWIFTNPDAFGQEVSLGVYILSALMILFSLLGCYAAIRESVRLTIFCAVFLLLLAILQIVVTCVDIDYDGENNSVERVQNAWGHDEMNTIQSRYECCGKTSVQDYILLNKEIPASCYVDGDTSNESNLFFEGCSVKLHEYLVNRSSYYGWGTWILIAFEILGFLLAIFLVFSFRNKQRRMQF